MDNRYKSEEFIIRCIREYLTDRRNGGSWWEDRNRQGDPYQMGVDLYMVGGMNNSERFLIECVGQYDRAGKEAWLNALGTLVTRMSVSTNKGNNQFATPSAYRYGLGLPKEMAIVALCRIPKAAAQILNLYIFSIDNDGFVKKWTPSQFGKEYTMEQFTRRGNMGSYGGSYGSGGSRGNGGGYGSYGSGGSRGNGGSYGSGGSRGNGGARGSTRGIRLMNDDED